MCLLASRLCRRQAREWVEETCPSVVIEMCIKFFDEALCSSMLSD